MRDQMENSFAHCQILVAKCNHLVAVGSPGPYFKPRSNCVWQIYTSACTLRYWSPYHAHITTPIMTSSNTIPIFIVHLIMFCQCWIALFSWGQQRYAACLLSSTPVGHPKCFAQKHFRTSLSGYTLAAGLLPPHLNFLSFFYMPDIHSKIQKYTKAFSWSACTSPCSLIPGPGLSDRKRSPHVRSLPVANQYPSERIPYGVGLGRVRSVRDPKEKIEMLAWGPRGVSWSFPSL
jgi:hypothetical protein